MVDGTDGAGRGAPIATLMKAAKVERAKAVQGLQWLWRGPSTSVQPRAPACGPPCARG